jgi:type II secretory pathway pseudopilin PulG
VQNALCALLQTLFLGWKANYSYLCIKKNQKAMTMILTNRELFLLIISTVIYITLFILVIQSNRRKIQLLQSRLDNIHAMQKLAVIEPRQDVSTVFASPVYLRTKQYLAEGRSMAEGDWAELTEAVNSVYTGFSEKLYSLYNMSDQDYRVSLLIKVRIQPKDIATLTAHSKESIASTRSRLYQKVFGKKGSTKDWDDFILSI